MIVHVYYAIGAVVYGGMIFIAGWKACAVKNGYVKQNTFDEYKKRSTEFAMKVSNDITGIKVDIGSIKATLKAMS